MRGEYHSRPESPATPRELPPRARRILIISDNTSDAVGTTSACAENTAAAGWRGCRGGNYLRVRGEYNSGTDRLFLNKELPPRARRIPVKLLIWWIMVGTTSACAENTFACSARVVSPWNYLRVRGEYNPARSTSQSEMELPPRARRIPNGALCTLKMKGTTSACAENTSLEDTNTYIGLELPPRARRIPPFWPGMRGGSGTTSACAENTFTKQLDGIMIRNYLRVRGEYYIYRNLASGGGNYLRVRGEYEDAGIGALSALELPPRARRIHLIAPCFLTHLRTTSACAENTLFF